jgi:hypothetical protein
MNQLEHHIFIIECKGKQLFLSRSETGAKKKTHMLNMETILSVPKRHRNLAL